MPVKPKAIMRRFVIAFSTRNRTRKAVQITEFMKRHDVRDAVFVGCSPGRNPNEAIVERAVADRAQILMACDILACTGLPWPFVRADGRSLPMGDRDTDMILANAVIEHVGGLADQLRFVEEQCRVGRSWVITTPNRWFPVESHTSAIVAHWSRRWRDQRDEFTRLLSRREFVDLLPADAIVVGSLWSPTFTAYWVGPADTAGDQSPTMSRTSSA